MQEARTVKHEALSTQGSVDNPKTDFRLGSTVPSLASLNNMSYQIVIESKQVKTSVKSDTHTALIAQNLVNLAVIRDTAAKIKEDTRNLLKDAKANGIKINVVEIRTALAKAKVKAQRISELLAEFGLQRGKASSKTSNAAKSKAENLLAKVLPTVKAGVKGLDMKERAAVIHRLTVALKAEFAAK
jgi:hypothetical protein